MEIRELRLKKGLKQKELADLLNISPAYLCELEKKKRRNPSIELIARMADALDVPISELITRKVG